MGRLFFALLALVVARRLLEADGTEKEGALSLGAWLLPLCIMGVFYVLVRGPNGVLRQGLELMVLMSVYYALLLPLLPRLRERFRAGFCSLLWFLPAVLLLVRQSVAWRWGLPRGLVALVIPWPVLRWILAVWMLGALVVMTGFLLKNRQVKKQRLAGAMPVEDEEILALWQEERLRLKMASSVRLLQGPGVSAPVSMGLVDEIVLIPRRDYAPEDLRLIFRHELWHLRRDDVDKKILLALFCSLCWFNPLVWLALRRAAEDMECRCDELVAQSLGSEGRQRYARLLLAEPGDSRGFSSCLSAEAEGLKRRVQEVLHPKIRKSGRWMVPGLLLVLFLMQGLVVLADEKSSGEEKIFSAVPGAVITDVSYKFTDSHNHTQRSEPILSAGDKRALRDYLSGLTLWHISDGSFDGLYHWNERELSFWLAAGGERILHVSLRNDRLELYEAFDTDNRKVYDLIEEPDWALLESLLN